MADAAINICDKEYTDSDDEGVNLLYLASTKRSTYKPTIGSIDSENIIGKNPNLLHDTIHDLEKLNVKSFITSSTARNAAASVGPGMPNTVSTAISRQIHECCSEHNESIARDMSNSTKYGELATHKIGKDLGDTSSSNVNPIKTLDKSKDKAIVPIPPICTTDMVRSAAHAVEHDITIAANDECVTSLYRKSLPTTEVELVHKKLPKVNCPEKIVICLDVSKALEVLSFHSALGDRFSAFRLLKRSLRIYLNMKHQLNANHQFALIILRDTAIWMSDFTCDIVKLLTIIDDLQDTFQTHTCHLSSLFEMLTQHVQLPEASGTSLLAPPFVLRVLLFYGRSHCIPTCHLLQHHKTLKMSPFFFLDVLYVHQPLSPDNMCEAIFEQLCELDEKGDCYILEVSHNPTRLHECVSRLLSHPLQRPMQTGSCYKLEDMVER